MAVSRDEILAGIAGGGASGSALAYFGPKGTIMPTTVDGALDADLRDMGWISDDGLTKGVDETSTDINAFGSQVPVRTLTTRSKITFGLAFLQSGPDQTAVYNRLPLEGAGSITVAVDGSFDFTEGENRVAEYGAVFEVVDGLNRIRCVVPVLQVTERGEYGIKAGEAITYPITCTAYPGSDGVAAHWYYRIASLAA